MTMGKIADILQQRGETEEALRIRREEQLPVFERLGDVRERAVTMSKIADILAQRGETEEALRIQVEEVLPSARRIGDTDLLAATHYRCAMIRLGRGDLDQEQLKLVFEELTESFGLFKKSRRVDGVAIVGAQLGQLLAAGGLVEEAESILEESATAFDKLGNLDAASQLRASPRDDEEWDLNPE